MKKKTVNVSALISGVLYIVFAFIKGRSLIPFPGTLNSFIALLMVAGELIIAFGLIASHRKSVIIGFGTLAAESFISFIVSIASGHWGSNPAVYWGGFLPEYVCTILADILIISAFADPGSRPVLKGVLAGCAELAGAVILDIALKGGFLQIISEIFYPVMVIAMILACISAPQVYPVRRQSTSLTSEEAVNVFEDTGI